MPGKESTGTYNTGCWGQGEVCLVHLGMSTEGREGKVAHLRGGPGARGPGWCSVVFHPDSPVSPTPSPSREEGYKRSQMETGMHRDSETQI